MGIQQGCLLAPLPFLLVTDILDIAIVQNSRIWPTPSQISGPGAQILGFCGRFDGIPAKGGATTADHEHSASFRGALYTICSAGEEHLNIPKYYDRAHGV